MGLFRRAMFSRKYDTILLSENRPVRLAAETALVPAGNETVPVRTGDNSINIAAK